MQRPRPTRTNAILPVIVRNEVAARIPHNGNTQRTDQGYRVAAEAVFICKAVAGLLNALADRSSQVLNERAEDTQVGLRGLVGTV